MSVHYSQPKGFVGRNICYSVTFDGVRYGSIVAGSAAQHLRQRDKFLGIDTEKDRNLLRFIIGNIFYHVEKVGGKYPIRNFTVKVLTHFRRIALIDWEDFYKERAIAYESLIELPRTGECYRRDGWTEVGITRGYTCKRESGVGTDSYTGKRVWNISELRPKRIFVMKVPNV